jgi:hypothetical protein
MMATLVLTTVGSLVAGPIGGAIGAVLGNQVDRAILKPKGRQGPRLGELSVQTSSYGLAIPRLFGTMRVAGTVIWATDLREETHRGGGGKAGGSTTSYSYSASFAVALSARRIEDVRRIWADGKLLRGAAGDWKGETGFRLHRGDEAQPVDPLIASAEGVALTPAHRGIAYAVFEDLQLADYGNRIPSLTFEVVADAQPIAAGAIAEEISSGALSGDSPVVLTGYAASGDSVRGALEALTGAAPMALLDDGSVLRFGSEAEQVLDRDALGASGDARPQPMHMRGGGAAGSLPDAVTITYYDPERDYQVGLQRARRLGRARREDGIDLPAALPGNDARTLAEQALARTWRERQKITAFLPWSAMTARAGSLVTLHGRRWRVGNWTLEHMALQLQLRLDADEIVASTPSDPGRAAPAPDVEAGTTRLMLLDLPPIEEGVATVPGIVLAAAGSRPGWRRAEASVTIDGGRSWRLLGRTAPPAVIGEAATVLGDGDAALFDRANSVEIELLHAGMGLQGADDGALAAGANLAMLGQELLQFGEATQIGATRFRLGRLTRGRRGTEWATAGHRANEQFVLLDRQTLLPVNVPVTALGATVTVTAAGPGDEGVSASATLDVAGQTLRPLAPAHLRADRLADGTIRFRWTRRSRQGWAWLDGSDVPLSEDAERYRIVLSRQGEPVRTIETAEPGYDYGRGEQVSDAVDQPGEITASVVQLGIFAISAPILGRWTL